MITVYWILRLIFLPVELFAWYIEMQATQKASLATAGTGGGGGARRETIANGGLASPTVNSELDFQSRMSSMSLTVLFFSNALGSFLAFFVIFSLQ